MRRLSPALTVTFAGALALAVPASAQSARAHGVVIDLNAGAQIASDALSDRFEFERNAETATADVKYPAKPGVLVDGGVGFRLWKRLGAGVSVSYVARDGSADVDARIPHPFVFQQPRTVTGTQDSIAGTETGVHAQVQYTVEASPRISFVLAGGPSWISVSQELVKEVQYSETYPYDTATFLGASASRSTASAAGANASIDFRWMFQHRLGVGALVRFTRAKVTLDAENNRRVTMNAGGVQAGVGLRFAF